MFTIFPTVASVTTGVQTHFDIWEQSSCSVGKVIKVKKKCGKGGGEGFKQVRFSNGGIFHTIFSTLMTSLRQTAVTNQTKC